MRESHTIRCPKCGGVMDVFPEVAAVEFNNDLGRPGLNVLVKWEDSLVEHTCKESS